MTVDLILYLLTGSFAGLTAGLLGVGGGIIIVPVLYFLFSSQNIEQTHVMHFALGTSLATIIFTSISSSYAHHKKHAVLWTIFLILAPGICIGAWAGGIIASSLNTDVLRLIFGIFELFIALHLLSRTKAIQKNKIVNKIKAGVGGIIIGTISAIVGIGGGTLTVPFLNWHNISIRNAVATSAACGFPIAVFGTASFIVAGWHMNGLNEYTLGYVDLTAFALISSTSFVCAPVGARLAHRISEKSLKIGFGLFLLLVSVKMLVG